MRSYLDCNLLYFNLISVFVDLFVLIFLSFFLQVRVCGPSREVTGKVNNEHVSCPSRAR